MNNCTINIKTIIMKTIDFKFNLPKELIAKYPIVERSKCRLLALNTFNGKITHHIFFDLIKQLLPGDLLVFNNTRVIPAKLYGRTIDGKKIEILVERILHHNYVLAYIRASVPMKIGTNLILGETLDVSVYIIDLYNNYDNKLFKIYFDDDKNNVLTILNKIGHIPIPPYLKRLDNFIDYELYQTIYSLKPGAVAAPTAGLHFDKILLNTLLNLGIEIAFITLHVGSASFHPVRVKCIENHIMYDEYIEVPDVTVDAILRCKKRKNRVIAVGTTVVKSLETASLYVQNNMMIAPFSGYARTFIFPGYRFRIVDALITNFHLSQSTLIMLVAAFSGYQNTFNAYYEAINLKYKFLSYGDAMFITHDCVF